MNKNFSKQEILEMSFESTLTKIEDNLIFGLLMMVLKVIDYTLEKASKYLLLKTHVLREKDNSMHLPTVF